MKSLFVITSIAICSAVICCRGDAQTNLPSGVVVPMPPFTNNNDVAATQDWRLSGIELMHLKNIEEGDAELRYSHWTAPTSIVVNTISYNVTTGVCSSFSVLSVDATMPFSADGFLVEKDNEKEARIAAFAEIAGSSSFTIDIVSARYAVNQIGNDLLRIASIEPQSGEDEIYQSKNIFVRINAPSNALDFAVAILNAGLPEAERIVLPPQE